MIIFAVTRSDTIGGVHTHIFDLIKSLNLSEEEYKILVGGEKKNIFIQRLNELGINYVLCPYLKREISLIDDLKTLNFLINYFLRIRPTLVWTHSSKAGILVRISTFFLRIPSIFTIHGWSFSSTKNLILRFIYINLERILINTTNLNILVSEYDYLLAKKFKIRIKNYRIIHNSSSIKLPRKNVRKILGSKSLRFVMVARLDKQKDHECVLKAFSLVAKKYKNWKLSFAGEGPLKNKLISLTNKLGIYEKVEFLGHVKNIKNLLQNSDIFILASHWEGFPMTTIEALSFGLPVIISDVCGSKEAVINDINGFIFQESNFLELANKIEFFLENPKQIEKKSMLSLRIYDNIFSFNIFQKKIQKAFNGVISSK